MQKRVLIITYYWPPAGGPGVQRWLKFVKYLPEYNVKPIVFVPENPEYPILDESLGQDVNPSLEFLKLPIKEPYKVAGLFSKSSKTLSKGLIPDKKNQSIMEKLMLFVRGNFFIPDARVSWVKPAVAFLTHFLKDNPVDAIITTGPPHSLHLIGLQLKEQLNLKWLTDFRDPWTSIDYHKELKLTKASERKHKALEKRVLTTADQIVVTSKTTKCEFSTITTTPIEVITNGYDVAGNTNTSLDTKFSMSHIGSLLSERNPEILWKVLEDLINEDTEFERSLRLNFVGAVSETVMDSLRHYNLIDYADRVGYVSHKESIIYQKKSQVLLLIESNIETKQGIIPGKLFEYMVSNRPILAIGPKSWEVDSILKETNTGTSFSYSDYSALRSKIIEYFEAFKSGTLQSHAVGLQKYSRKNLTGSLVKLL